MKFSALKIKLLLLAVVSSSCCADPTESQHRPTVTVEYFEISNETESGIGFPAGGKFLYIGGCDVFDTAKRKLEGKCIYPPDIRWAVMSPDGSRLLATAIDKSNGSAKSFQIDAVTAKIISTKKGVYFYPPVAIHPSNAFWIAARAGENTQGSEMLTATKLGQWKSFADGIDAQVRRIYSLAFIDEGKMLVVNGGPPVGTTLHTSDWTPTASMSTSTKFSSVQSRDGRYQAKLGREGLQIVDAETQAPLADVELDMSREEPQMAFSWDGRWFAAKGYRATPKGNSVYSFALIELPR